MLKVYYHLSKTYRNARYIETGTSPQTKQQVSVELTTRGTRSLMLDMVEDGFARRHIGPDAEFYLELPGDCDDYLQPDAAWQAVTEAFQRWLVQKHILELGEKLMPYLPLNWKPVAEALYRHYTADPVELVKLIVRPDGRSS